MPPVKRPTGKKKVNLPKDYIFHSITYLKGEGVEVPADFPDLDADGEIIHPEGSSGARNQALSRMRNGVNPSMLTKGAEEPPAEATEETKTE